MLSYARGASIRNCLPAILKERWGSAISTSRGADEGAEPRVCAAE